VLNIIEKATDDNKCYFSGVSLFDAMPALCFCASAVFVILNRQKNFILVKSYDSCE
jgi:hypothetical protein